MANRHDDIDFERSDVTIGPIVWFISGLAVCTGIAMLGLWWMQGWIVSRERAGKQPERPLTAAAAQRPDEERWPPEPRVEGLGGAKASHSVTNSELPTSARNQRAREEEQLTKGWTDAAGKKHPPIADAIRMLIEKEGKR